MVDAFAQAPALVASENVTIGPASQLSVAVAVPFAAGEESSSHSMVTSGGIERTGSVVSSIVIV